jgi:Flp pilus assembly protein TadG
MGKTLEINFTPFQKTGGLMSVHRTLIRDDMGQAFVELALVLPIFILLLIGAALFGRLAFAAIEISNAARAGVAYGSQNHTTASDNAGIQLAATQDAPDVTGLTATATQVCSCTSGTAITCANAGTTCISPGRIIESVQVNTSATVNSLFNYPGMATTFTLHGQAIMRVEQ